MTPPTLHAGMRIAGKYVLTRRVGSGAMGEVWAAEHLSLGEEVAIKLVMRDVAHEDGTSNATRFLLEARVAAQLSRKTRHIVSVTDHGEVGPFAYLVMELLVGESLDQRLERTGALSLEKAIPLVQQVARALSVAHAEGVVHRDLKPSNVFVTTDEDGKAVIKILDFGIAKLRASLRRVAIPTVADAKHQTLSGFLLGTPAYMSPEQARGERLDQRADVWALGVITYHLLTGQFPFDGDTAEALLARLVRVDPFPITKYRSDLPPGVSELFRRAFSRVLDHRFQTAAAFTSALEAIDTRRTTAPPISLPPPDDVDLELPVRTTQPRVYAFLAGILAIIGLAVLWNTQQPTKPHGLTASTTLTTTTTSPSTDEHDSIPPPPEAVSTPAKAPSRPKQPLPPTTAGIIGIPPAVAAPPASPSPPIAEQRTPIATPSPPKRVDKSEVF